MHVKFALLTDSLRCWVWQAMSTPNFAIAFAFEIKLTGGNNHSPEIIVVASDIISLGAHVS